MQQDQEFKGVVGAFVLFGVIALAGVIVAYASVSDYAEARASLSWPKVDGVILTDSDGDGVRYSWFDGERSHVGNRVRFSTAAITPDGRLYQPGERVLVHISPADSSRAVLEPGGDPFLFAAGLGGGAFLVFLGLAGVIRLVMTIDGLQPAPESEYDLAPAE